MATYEVKLICCMCKKCYGTKPGGNRPGVESHGFCGDECVADFYRMNGMDPETINKEGRHEGTT